MFKLSLILGLSLISLTPCVRAKDASLSKEWGQFVNLMKTYDQHPSMYITTRKKMNETQCNKDMWHVVEDFLNNKKWAHRMVDATGKFPTGFLSGNRILYGSLDDCLAVEPEHGIKPQFCTLSVTNVTTIRFLNIYFNWARYPYMFLGVCLPASCRGKYFAHMLQGMVSPKFKFKLSDVANITVKPGDCQTADSVKPWTELNERTMWIFGVLLAFVVFASLLGLCVDSSQKGVISSFVEIFSVAGSGRKLFVVDNVDAKMAAINGLRGLAAVNIVWAHSTSFTSMGNGMGMMGRGVLTTLASRMTALGFFTVDFFLFMSGLLATVSFFIKLTKDKSYDPLKAVIMRYLRLTVPAGLVILYKMGLSEHMDNGPIYNVMTRYYRRPCATTVGPTLLGYVNLLPLKPHEMCYQQMWYTSIDFQLFLISQLILLISWWKLKAVPYISLGLGLALTVNTFIIAYTFGLAPHIGLAGSDGNNIYDYTKTHTRGVPWFFGMFLGCLIAEFQARPRKISKVSQWVMWILCLTVVVMTVQWYDTFGLKTYTQPSSALYLSLSRVLFSFVFGWLVFAILLDMAGWLGSLLSWYPFDFLGRISFEIFLVHVAVIEYVQASSRELHYFTKDSKWHLVLTPLAYTLPCAVIFNLVITSPWNKIVTRLSRTLSIWSLRSPLPNKEQKAVEPQEKRLEEEDGEEETMAIEEKSDDTEKSAGSAETSNDNTEEAKKEK